MCEREGDAAFEEPRASQLVVRAEGAGDSRGCRFRALWCSGCTPALSRSPPPRIRKTFWAAHQVRRMDLESASTAARGTRSRADGWSASSCRGSSTLPASRRRVVRAGYVSGLLTGDRSQAEASAMGSSGLPARRGRVIRARIAGLDEGSRSRAEAAARWSTLLPASRRRMFRVGIAGLSARRWACRSIQICEVRPSVQSSTK